MSEVTLTKEQVGILHPLLQINTLSSDEPAEEKVLFTTSSMFERKKKNSKSTAAQNYLLVS